MKTIKIAGLLSAVLFCVKCNPSINQYPDLIPKPQSSDQENGHLILNKNTTIFVSNQELTPLAQLFAVKTEQISGLRMTFAKTKTDQNQVQFEINKTLEEEEYRLVMDANIHLAASTYQCVAWGVASIAQLAIALQDKVRLPKLSISDKPDYAYRTVLIDLARFWHPVETIYETIDLLWFYKIPYLHLHLSDNNRFTRTFRSTIY